MGNAAGITFQSKMNADSKLLEMIDIRWNWVQELQNNKIIKAVKVDTKGNVADLLTKCHNKKTFDRLSAAPLEIAQQLAVA